MKVVQKFDGVLFVDIDFFPCMCVLCMIWDGVLFRQHGDMAYLEVSTAIQWLTSEGRLEAAQHLSNVVKEFKNEVSE